MLSKMSCEIANDLERQEDEMSALSSIYNETEFFWIRSECIKCSVSIFPKFFGNSKKLKVNLTNHRPTDATVAPNDHIFVEYLPPIRLYVRFPDTYPSKKPPNFNLSVIWLTPWEISFICQKLDEIWQENQGNEIIFLWLDFLQNGFFDFLNMQDSLDVSFMHLMHTTRDSLTFHLAQLSDPRAVNTAMMSLDIKKLLMTYNREQHKVQFNKNFHICDICFEEYIGLNCIELENCGHIYCKSCMEKHISTKINEYISLILCPTIDCKREISHNDVKALCPDLFSRYEEITLRVTLDTMDDVVYCPQVSCQYPIIRDPDDDAPICPICNYCFCIYCRKSYHGQASCEMAMNDITKLINEYKNSSNMEKKALEKKYGKRQMQSVEKRLSDEYLQDNAKSCPKCRSFISKTEGCNKITCIHCQSYFCWLCNELIYGYEHFSSTDSQCFGLLFDSFETDEFDYVNPDVMDIIHQYFIDLNV